jgi:hypothetical protein
VAQKKIGDLTLRSSFDATCSLPVDDATQTWRCTGAQLKTYMATQLAPIAPTVQKFTSGSGTYTKPANVLFLRVRLVGGGGGGGGSAASGNNDGGTGTTGGNTTFGTTLLVANGGLGGAKFSAQAGEQMVVLGEQRGRAEVRAVLSTRLSQPLRLLIPTPSEHQERAAVQVPPVRLAVQAEAAPLL